MRNYYKKRVSPWWRRGAIILLAVVALVAAVKLIDYGVQLGRARSLRNELSAEVRGGGPATATPVPDGGDAPAATVQPVATVGGFQSRVAASGPEIRLSLAGLQERNPDLVGWVQLDALSQVDLPVVQRDHTYYLTRDFDGNYNSNGTPFMDIRCSIMPRSDNLIVYAHNMKSGEMFGTLQRLTQEIYYRSAPMAHFSTLYDSADYVPVAVVLCSIHPGERYFNFGVTEFSGEEAFNAYIARARELSDVQPPYDVRYGDELLTLVTCHDEAHQYRLVVILRRVRPDEDPLTLATMWK